MQTKHTTIKDIALPFVVETNPSPLFRPERVVEYFGCINYATSERVLLGIKKLMQEYPHEELFLMVTSTGGPTGTAMSFCDTIRYVLRANVVTIGSGDVDSSGLLLLCVGNRRYVTKNTTALLHLAGRIFDGNKRYTAAEMELMAKEDRIKDMQYAAMVAERSKNLTKEDVLLMMERNTVLQPEDLLSFGFVDQILT